jgi:hypothetical protein
MHGGATNLAGGDLRRDLVETAELATRRVKRSRR